MCTLSQLFLISFCSNKVGVYIMREIKKLIWLQACFLGDVRVIWCNSLGDSLFQIYVMNFVEIVIAYYSHITLHVSQAFASCTHYTSYFLLNIVHVFVCVFRFDQPSLQILWVLMQNRFDAWEFMENVWNFIFGKTGFKTVVFEKNISSHTHAFSFINFNALRCF